MKLRCLKPRLAPPAAAPGWQPDALRGTRHQRGYGYAWEKLRAQVLERDNGLCTPCLRKGHITLAHQVDHITPKAHGGTDDMNNLQAICDECHRTKTSSESRGGR